MTTAGPHRTSQLLDAVVAIGSGLDLPEMLQRIIDRAIELVDAEYGALGVIDERGVGLEQFITAGMDDEQRAKIGDLPQGHGILGLLIVEAKPVRLPDLNKHPDSYGFPPGHPPMTTFLGVPIRVRGRAFGNLYLTDKRSKEPFTEVDEDLVVGLASAAGVAIENSRLHSQVADLAMVTDRERIARDLHDTVIQRLFATGLSLQTAGPLVTRDPAKATERIDAAIDELDITVKEIRSSIFALERHARPTTGIRDQAVAVCREATDVLGFEPAISFSGPLDSVVDASVRPELLATLREALTNVARHAKAHSVSVALSVTDDAVTLRVTDDGVGPPDTSSSRGHGVPNMAARATSLGGKFVLSASAPTGTMVEWTVPRSGAEPISTS